MRVFQSGWSVHAKLQSGFDSQTAGQKHGGDARRVSTEKFPIPNSSLLEILIRMAFLLIIMPLN